MKNVNLFIIFVLVQISTSSLLNAESKRSSESLDYLRTILEQLKPYDEREINLGTLNLSLKGYLGYWELDLGREHRVVIINQMRGAKSVILAFSETQLLSLYREVGAEISWVALCDFNEDGVSELIIDQLDGWGTGVLDRTYRVYRIDKTIQELWSATSLSVHGDPGGATIRGFLKCEQYVFAQLLYYVENLTERDGLKTARHALKFDVNGLSEVSWPTLESFR